MITRRQIMLAGAAASLAGPAAVSRAADTYPSKVVRLVVPYGPGGGADNFARPFAQQLGQQLGQQVIIDNRAGASGVVGGVNIVQSPPDGYSLLCNFASLYLAPVVMKNPPYDPVKEFTPIVDCATTPMVVVVHSSLPVKNMTELMAYTRNNPDGTNYVTAGAGTQQHLTGETIAARTGLKFTHVPYKGGSQAMADLVGGQVKMGILVLSTVLPLIQKGQLRAIGVIEGHRSANYPDIPTLSEAGLTGFAMPDMFIGLFGPAKLPQAIVERISTESYKAMKVPAVAAALRQAGYEPKAGGTPAEFTALGASTYATFQKMANDVHLKFE